MTAQAEGVSDCYCKDDFQLARAASGLNENMFEISRAMLTYQSTARFCSETTTNLHREDYLGRKGPSDQTYEQYLVNPERSKLWNENVWAEGLSPTEKVRNKVFNRMFYNRQPPLLALRGPQQLSNFLSSAPAGNIQAPSVEQRAISSQDRESLFLSEVGISKEVLSSGFLGLCGFISAAKTVACAAHAEKAFEWVRPNALTSLPDLCSKVTSDTKYEAGLRRAAQKIIQLAKSGSFAQQHLYDDLYSSFKESGSSDADAEENTWDVLGVLSTAGPNIQDRLDAFPGGSEVSKVALAAIAQSIPILDQRSFQSGHPYSYPKELVTHCNNGKPYHFWMAAYLARRLSKTFGDADASRAAAFVLSEAYEMRKTGAGRDPVRIFREAPLADYANMMRIDLAYTSAGSAYGAGSNDKVSSKKEINVDLAVKQILLNARYESPLPSQEADRIWGYDSSKPVYNIDTKLFHSARAFLRWKKIMSPKSAYSAFNDK